MKKSTIVMVVLIATIIISPTLFAGPVQDLVINIDFYGPKEDINNDGEVDVIDGSELVTHWGDMGEPGWVRSDVNDNGEVEVLDASAVSDKWGTIWIIT